MKKLSLVVVLIVSLALAFGVIAAEVWADNVVVSVQGPAYSGSISPARSNPAAALDSPDNNGSDETTFFSLGKEGYVVVKLAEPVSGSLEIYEATWGCNAGYANEGAYVSVSPDGVNWTSVGTADNKSDKTCYNGAGFVTPLNLNECIQYVKVQDWGQGTLGDGFDVDAVGGNEICQFTITVDIDIKPGSDPSCFNSNEHGVIPVAIFGSADFDVTQIDVGTVSLDGAEVAVKGKADKALAAYEDVNGDGFMDLSVKIVDMGGYTPGDTYATLTGNLLPEFGGTAIEGTGDICITQ